MSTKLLNANAVVFINEVGTKLDEEDALNKTDNNSMFKMPTL